MRLCIESVLTGITAGFAYLDVDPSYTVKDVIEQYAQNKEVNDCSHYGLHNETGIWLDEKDSLKKSKLKDGDKVYLVSQECEPMLFEFGYWWFMAGLSLFFAIAGVVGATVSFVYPAKSLYQYGIVFNSGPNETNLSIFKWDSVKKSNTGNIQQIFYCSVDDAGLTNFVEQPENISIHLSICLEKGRPLIPPTDSYNTNIYLGATGAMRLLRIKDRSASDVLLVSAQKYLQTSGFSFLDYRAQILSGELQGMSSWSSANYLLSNLNLEPCGVLDVDESSAQAAVLTDVGGFPVDLFGRNYSVFAHSVSCYGLKEIRNRYLSLLVEPEFNETDSLPDPCLPVGFTEGKNAQELFASTCSQRSEYPTEVGEWQFYGTGDSQECQTSIKQLFDEQLCKDTFFFQQCFDKPQISEDTFAALSDYASVVAELGLGSKTTEAKFLAAAERTCSEQNTSLCFDAFYIHALLTYGYSFTKNDWKNITFINEVDGWPIDWSTGWMLTSTSEYADVFPEGYLDTTSFILLLILFTAFFILSLAFFIHAYSIRRFRQTYQRMMQLKTEEVLGSF